MKIMKFGNILKNEVVVFNQHNQDMFYIILEGQLIFTTLQNNQDFVDTSKEKDNKMFLRDSFKPNEIRSSVKYSFDISHDINEKYEFAQTR